MLPGHVPRLCGTCQDAVQGGRGVAGLAGCRTGGVGLSQAAEHPQRSAQTLLCRRLSTSPWRQTPLLPRQALPENCLASNHNGTCRVLVGMRVLPFWSRSCRGRKGCASVSSFAQVPKRNRCPCSPSLSSTAFTRHSAVKSVGQRLTICALHALAAAGTDYFFSLNFFALARG